MRSFWRALVDPSLHGRPPSSASLPATPDPAAAEQTPAQQTWILPAAPAPRSHRALGADVSHTGAVSAVILGATGVAAIVVPQTQAAANGASLDPTAVAANARALDQEISALDPRAVADARRALWSSFVASGATRLDDALTDVLAAAGGDGSITGAELAAAESLAAGGPETQESAAALARAFIPNADRLSPGAAALLFDRISGVETHAARAQSLVNELLAGEQRLVDTNGDKKVDAGDLVLTKRATGGVAIERIGQTMADQVKVAQAIVNAAHALDGAGIGFSTGEGFKANPKYWTIEPGAILTPRAGVKPSDAMRDLLVNGAQYKYECATGIIAAWYLAILEVIGPNDFDIMAKDLRLGGWRHEDDLGAIRKASTIVPGTTEKTPGEFAKVPGTNYYFRNWSVQVESAYNGWQGENVLYLGEGQYYGHGIGIGDEARFVSALRSHATPESAPPALINLQGWLDATEIAKRDFTPNE